jgi:hypothetical protein
MSSYFYLLYKAINVKYPGIKQLTNPMTMFVALEVKVTIKINIPIATSNELGFTPRYFGMKYKFSFWSS